jgi:uncharacterized protein YndB with AHSA1/START domain
MSTSVRGDEARATVLVKVAPTRAFALFTEEIDQWWRRGDRYRVAGAGRGIIALEGRVGGRLFESFDSEQGERVAETGRVLVWEPPSRFVLEWRNVNFAPAEKTEVEVTFRAQGQGTLVTVVHRGWASIRPDHPARHGLDVVAFIRMMGLWWGDLLSSLREVGESA